MNHFSLIFLMVLTFTLSACGVSEPLIQNETDKLVNLASKQPGCTLPTNGSGDSEPLSGCIVQGCIRYTTDKPVY